MTIQNFLAIWAVIGPLLGVALGAGLTMWIQKRHWVLDSKTEEYRELLSTLSQSVNVIVEFYASAVAHGPKEQRAEHAAELKALEVISDRLFIAEEVKRIGALTRWTKAIHELKTGGHSQAFARAAGDIMADITTSAKRMVR